MQEIKTIDILNLDGCRVRDESGEIVAVLREKDGAILVRKTAACTLGTYLYIVSYLNEMGIEAK